MKTPPAAVASTTTPVADAAKIALPMEATRPETAIPMRTSASHRAAPEPSHPHRDHRTIAMSLATTQEAQDTWNDVSEAGKEKR